MTDEHNNDEGMAHHGIHYLREKIRKMQSGQLIRGAFPRKAQNTELVEQAPSTMATSMVNLLVYPQDPLLGEPETRPLAAEDVQAELTNARVKVIDKEYPIAQQDDKGSYFYWADTPQFDQVNAFYYVTFTLRMFERYAQRALAWSFLEPRILVNVHVGDNANAFYNEQEKMLGFHSYMVDGKPKGSTAHSADIVSHETGHAVLDGMRDLWNESFGLGCRALHESFGDMAAVLVALHDDSLVQRMLKWTNNDLRVSNIISEVAEHLAASDDQLRDATIETIYLRNAINPFVDVPFDLLPHDVPDPEMMLSRQEHNYGRVFTGAFWDILAAIYEDFAKTEAPFIAVTYARRVMGEMLALAVELSPVGEAHFADMARAFITAESIVHEGKYEAILRNVFAKRQILPISDSDAMLQFLTDLPDIRLPEDVTSTLTALTFYEQQIVPKMNWEAQDVVPLAIYRNSVNYTFMTFFETRALKLQGEEFKDLSGVLFDVYGGVTLMFDAELRLRSAVLRSVSEEDLRQVKLCIVDMHQSGRISQQIHEIGSIPLPTPKALLFRENGDRRLIKYPTLVDRVPVPRLTFRDYLLKWRNTGIRNE